MRAAGICIRACPGGRSIFDIMNITPDSGKGEFRHWLIVLIALADDVAVLVLILLVMWIFGLRISLPVLVPLAVALGGTVFLVHRAVVPSLKRSRQVGREAMLGDAAEVVEPLNPAGTVKIAGEYWQARAVSGEIAAGKTVEIVSIERMVLKVKERGGSG
jgi:membrane-bound ClpP family serine protease